VPDVPPLHWEQVFYLLEVSCGYLHEHCSVISFG
jgi:hypothetical protein